MTLREKYKQEMESLENRLSELKAYKSQIEATLFSGENNSLSQNEQNSILQNYSSKKYELLETDAEIYLIDFDIRTLNLLFQIEENNQRWLEIENISSQLILSAIFDLARLDELRIHGGLKTLPSEIKKLGNLIILDLSGNDLSNIPPEIGELSNLETLDLSQNKITTLPMEIGRLAKLNYLCLHNNHLSSLPLTISKLHNLEILDLAKNHIDVFPGVISTLQNLRQLYLSNNKVKELPSNISELSNLEFLDMTLNNLSDLPNTIGKLQKLYSLNLSGNNIYELPREIGDLINLEILCLGTYIDSDYDILSLEEFNDLPIKTNRILNLPLEIQDLKKLEWLDLTQNPITIPPEILEDINQPQKIINYYFSLQKKQQKQLLESKLLVVGQGSVGKTSLIQQILYGIFDSNQVKTEGIAINQWQVTENTHQNNESLLAEVFVKLNLWDFGGQEIMHATHQFFLTKRSLYLLVLDSRLTQEENRVEYWLKIIQSFGGESPVLIVGNKIDQHPLDIDRTGLQKKYPNIVGILETSAATGAGIEELKAAIAEQVNNLPHVRDLLPETWFTVKTKLEELGKQSNFITQEKYLDLCAENEVSDETSQRTLIGFLHDLGVVLHFQDDPRLEALGILNPQWVTNGVYKILNSHALFQNKGVLTLSMLNDILNIDGYPRDKRLFIVDMMKKFELCYDLEPDKAFLVPDLLPKDEPATDGRENALAFQYHYTVLPTSVITRFIVRMNEFVDEKVWRTGAVLKDGGNTALVKADIEERKVFIWVSGEEHKRHDFLSKIRGQFDAIHRTISKLEVKEMVPVPGHPESEPVDYDLLLQMDHNNVEVYPVLSSGKMIVVKVREMLNGVARQEDRQRGNVTNNIYISGDVSGNIVTGNENEVTAKK